MCVTSLTGVRRPPPPPPASLCAALRHHQALIDLEWRRLGQGSKIKAETMILGRPLADPPPSAEDVGAAASGPGPGPKSFALLFLNNKQTTQTITCDSTCLGKLNVTGAGGRFAVTNVVTGAPHRYAALFHLALVHPSLRGHQRRDGGPAQHANGAAAAGGWGAGAARKQLGGGLGDGVGLRRFCLPSSRPEVKRGRWHSLVDVCVYCRELRK
eukprot:COSAG01_NODE_5401_length_4294_cov_154.339226_6_plen_213_part_00